MDRQADRWTDRQTDRWTDITLYMHEQSTNHTSLKMDLDVIPSHPVCSIHRIADAFCVKGSAEMKYKSQPTFVNLVLWLVISSSWTNHIPFSLAKKVEGTKIGANTTFRSFQRQQIKVNLRLNTATDEPSLKKPKKVWLFWLNWGFTSENSQKVNFFRIAAH